MSENETSLYDELTSPMSYDEDNSADTGSGSGGTGGSADTYELYFSLNRTEGINLLHSTSNLNSILSIRYKSNNIEYDAIGKYCTYSVISSNNYGYLLKINVKSYSSPIYIHFNGAIVDINGISWYYPSSSDIVITVQSGSITSAMRGSSIYSDNMDGFTGSTAADPYRILFGSLMTKTLSGQISIHLPSTTGGDYGDAWNTREYGEIEFIGVSGNSNEVTCEKVDNNDNCIFNIYMSEEDKTRDVTLKFKMVEEPYKEVDTVVNLGASYNHTLVINPKEHHIHFKWNIQDAYGSITNAIEYEIVVACEDFQEVVMSGGVDVNNYKNYITFDWSNIKEGYIEFDIHKKPAGEYYTVAFQEKGTFEAGLSGGAVLDIYVRTGDEFEVHCDSTVIGHYTEYDKTLNPNAGNVLLTSTVDYDFVTSKCKYWLYCSYGTDFIPLLKDDLIWTITDEDGNDMSSHVLMEDNTSSGEILLTITTRKPLSFIIKPTFWDAEGYNSYSFNVPYKSNYDTYVNSNYEEYVYLPEFKDYDQIDFENYKIQETEVTYTAYLTINGKILNSYGITPSFSFVNGDGLAADDFIKSYNYNSSTGYLTIITNQGTDFGINMSFSKYISDYKLNVYYRGSESQNLGTISLDDNLSYAFYVYGINTEGDNISRNYLTFGVEFGVDSDSSSQYSDNVNISEQNDSYKVTVNGYAGGIGYFMTNYSLPTDDNHFEAALCSYGYLNVSFDDFYTTGSSFDISIPDPRSIDYIKFTDAYNNAWDNATDGVLSATINDVTIYQTSILPSSIESYASISKVSDDTFAITSNFSGSTIYPYGGYVSVEVSATNPESNIEYTKRYTFNRFNDSVSYEDNPIVEPFNTFYNEDIDGGSSGSSGSGDTPSYIFTKTIIIYKNGEATDENVMFNIEYKKDAITNEEYTFEDVETDIGFVPFNNITIKSKVDRPIRVRCSLINDPTCFGWVTIDKYSENGLKLNMISNTSYKPADITTTNSTGKSVINFSDKSVIKKTFKIPGYKPVTLWVDNNTPKLKLYLEKEIGVMNEDYSIELTNLPAGAYTLKYEDVNGNILTDYDSLIKNYNT